VDAWLEPVQEVRIAEEREANGLRWFGRKNCLGVRHLVTGRS